MERFRITEPGDRDSNSPTFSGRTAFIWMARLFVSGLLWAALSAGAQPSSPPPLSDPLMSLMLSQPPIDVVSPVRPVSGFDPPVVRPGEDSTYRVTFNALEQSIEWPTNLDALSRQQARAAGHGQVLALGPSTLQPRTTFNYHLRVQKSGTFTVPEFTVNVYGKPVTVPAAELEVTDTPTPPPPPAQRLVLGAPTTNLFVGQMVRFTVACPPASSLVSQGFSPLEIVGNGWLVDQSSFRQRYEVNPRGVSSGIPAVVCEAIATPLVAGRLSAFAQGFFVTRISGTLILNSSGAINGALLPYTLLDSDPVEFQVRPLPREGVLPGFTGAVGMFGLATPELTTNSVRVGEPVKLRVKVRGDGNLARLAPPPGPKSRDWEVFVSRPDATPSQVIQAQGYTTLEFTLVPLSTRAQATPPIPFSFFEPTRSTYMDLTIPSVPIQVLPGAAPTEPQALVQAGELDGQTEKEPVLSGIASAPGRSAASLVPLQCRAWYPLLQLAPAGAFLGLWSWDRRRRYREAHPDVVRRHRARRALRKEQRAIERAARVGDAARFAESAVAAMRVVAAPHYPAEPRALVGADVLALLSDTERSGQTGEVVRRFFGVTDAARFSSVPAAGQELLSLRADLDRALVQLEEKL